MNLDSYNFYGNYEVEDQSFSIFEIHKRQRQKEIRKLGLYKKILNRCFYKIRLAVEKDQLFCFFQLPEYVSGSPLYNMTDCLFFMLNELSKKGFHCKYCHPLQIYITWPQKEKNLRLDNKKPVQPQSKIDTKLHRLEKEMNLNYRSTGDYNSKIDMNMSLNNDTSITDLKSKFDNIPINNKNIVFNNKRNSLYSKNLNNYNSSDKKYYNTLNKLTNRSNKHSTSNFDNNKKKLFF